MTCRNKRLNKAVWERMQREGEPFSVARRAILEAIERGEDPEAGVVVKWSGGPKPGSTPLVWDGKDGEVGR